MEKRGGLTTCPQCHFEPQELEDQSLSIALSDHYLSHEQLRNASDAIQSGEEPELDSNIVNEIEQELRSSPQTMRMPIGCHIAVWIPIITMIALIIVVIAVYIWLLSSST